MNVGRGASGAHGCSAAPGVLKACVYVGFRSWGRRVACRLLEGLVRCCGAGALNGRGLWSEVL